MRTYPNIVTRDATGTRRYHIIAAPDLASAQRTARARHSAETGAAYETVLVGERTLNKPRFEADIEYDPLLGSVKVKAVP